jgi:hypothetical protein
MMITRFAAKSGRTVDSMRAIVRWQDPHHDPEELGGAGACFLTVYGRRRKFSRSQLSLDTMPAERPNSCNESG